MSHVQVPCLPQLLCPNCYELMECIERPDAASGDVALFRCCGNDYSVALTTIPAIQSWTMEQP